MSKAAEIHYKAVIAANNQEPPKDYVISSWADHFNGFVKGFVEGYNQAEKDVAESFARIIRGNLSMIDKSIQDKFEQLYAEITAEKMYQGFKD